MNRRMNGYSGLLSAANKAAAEQAGKVTLDDQIDEIAKLLGQCNQAKAHMARSGQLKNVGALDASLARLRAIMTTLSMVRAGVTNLKAPADVLPGLDAQMIVVIFAALVEKFQSIDHEGERGGYIDLEPELFSTERQNVRVEWAVTEGGGFTIRTMPLKPGAPSAPIPEVSA